MSQQIRHLYQFDEWQVDATGKVLLRDGEMVALTQKAFEVLLVLIEQHGQIVNKDELIQRVWRDSFVEERNVAQNVYTLRKILGRTPDGKEYIQTIPRRGYRFAVSVSESRVESESAALPAALSLAPEAVELKIPVNIQVTDFQNKDAASEFELNLPASIAEAEVEPQQKTIRAHPAARARKPLTIILTAGILIAFAAAAWWWLRQSHAGPFRQMTVTSLTNTGNIQCAAISPDGNYVAWAQSDSSYRSSLWLTRPATAMSRVIIESAEARYHALSFSPDGSYIYYVMIGNDDPVRTLYRVSVLGGPARKLLENVDNPVSFSPDGSQFVFRRWIAERRQSGLFIAQADGSGVKEIASLPNPGGFRDPAWSPDGRVIACAAGLDGGRQMYVAAISAGDWRMTTITKQKWRWIGQVAWLRDSRALMMTASDHPASPFQIWRLTYPAGEARRVTNDSSQYQELSISADSTRLIALQRRLTTSLWLVPAKEGGKPEQITVGSGGFRSNVSWTPDDRIVYNSELGNVAAISVMNADGSGQQQLTGDQTGRAWVSNATVSPDGRFIVYASDLTGARHIWRMDIDGGNPVQLTNGAGEDHPFCSPDGRTVVYTRTGADKPTIWKVPIDGGEPTQLTTEYSMRPAVSPDGKLIACVISLPTEPGGKLALVPIEGGPPVRVFPNRIHGAPFVRWTPDGRHLTYDDNPPGPSKIWLQPVDGGAPKLLAEFATDRIFGFDWSRDGSRLACVRGLWALNVVMLSD